MYGHSANACMNVEPPASQYEEAQFVGAYGGRPPVKNDPFSNTYNPGWRNHPNFSWREAGPSRQMGPPGFQNQQRPVYPPPQQRPAQDTSMEDMMKQYMAKMDAKLDQVAQSSQASIHNLEVQVSQLAKLFGDRGQGKLSSNTEINPKEGRLNLG